MKALDRSWAGATWEGARRNARRLSEDATLAEKLEWLESAEQLALSLGRRARGERSKEDPETEPNRHRT